MNTKQIFTYFLMGSVSLLTPSCNGLFSGLYDEPFDENEIVSDSEKGVIHCVNFDVTGYDSWRYVNLLTMKVVGVYDIPTSSIDIGWDGRSGITYQHGLGAAMSQMRVCRTATQPEPAEWDIAFHHFDVKTNGLSAAVTRYKSFEEFPEDEGWLESLVFVDDEWTDNQVIFDMDGMLNYDIGYQNSYVNQVLTSWVTMDLSTPPPIYNMSDYVRVVRMKNGQYAAIKLYNYINNSGAKGFLTFDVKFL